jgi:hypothetical protein
MAGRCFVALAFANVVPVYTEGIRPALVDCGYSPACMHEVQLTKDDICHRMLAEIRKAQFAVADLTDGVPGVYFEGGFALALGRDVFWTCRENSTAKAGA